MDDKFLLELVTLEEARRDPYTFAINYCYTVDETDGQIKLFPRMGDRKICSKCKCSWDLDENDRISVGKDFFLNPPDFGICPVCGRELQVMWAYLKILIDTWKNNKDFLLPKTRQMMASWTMVICHLWLAIFYPIQHIVFQSKTEDKAMELVKRTKDIYNHLPEIVKAYGELLRPPSQTEFWFKNGSRIKSVPKGVDQVTGLTLSALLSDEMAIQEECKEAYYEARPTLGGKGRFSGISTPNGKEFFYMLVHDKNEGDVL